MAIIRTISNHRISILVCILVIYAFNNPTDSGAIQLTEANLNQTLASNELVFVNFYLVWDHASKWLIPVFDDAADKVAREFPETGKVVLAKVDYDEESSIARRFHITKFPALRMIRYGRPAKRNYNGEKSAEAFVSFIKKELEDPVKEYHDLAELATRKSDKRVVIGYFPSKDQPEYSIFRHVAMSLKDDCVFHVGFGEALKPMQAPCQPLIVYGSEEKLSYDLNQAYTGSLQNFDDLYSWASENCVRLVAEMTCENADVLKEEGLPFLILFHAPDDKESVRKYKEIVQRELLNEKEKIKFLTADGTKFAHSLLHLGKYESDLPVIAIESFQHLYLFPKTSVMDVPGKLKQFVEDFHSGKLHREFHYGKDSETGKRNTSPEIISLNKL